MKKQVFIWITGLILIGILFAFSITPPQPEAISWIQWELTYPITIAASTIFVTSSFLKTRNIEIKKIKNHTSALLTIGFALAAIHSLEPHFLKVTFDEQCHLATAYQMQQDGRTAIPIAAHFNLREHPVIDAYATTYRSHYFAFMVATFSFITGFSENLAYVVNALIGIGICITTYLIGNKITNNRTVGIATTTLLLGTPIFGQVICSGSYDAANLFFLSLTLYACILYRENPDRTTLILLLSSTTILSYCRVESIAYFPLVALLIIYINKGKLPFEVCLALPFTIPSLTTQLVLLANKRNITQGQVAAGTPIWGTSNLLNNWQDSIVYFLNGSPTKMGCATLFVLGVAGVVLFLTRNTYNIKKLPRFALPLFLFPLLSFVLYSVVMGSPWGGPSLEIVMTRFTLPLWFFLSLWACFALKAIKEKWRIQEKTFIKATLLWFITLAVPRYANHDVALAFDYSQADRELVKMAKSIDDKRTLFVYESAASFISRGLPCVDYKFFINNEPQYEKLIRMGAWSKIVFMNIKPTQLLTGKLPKGTFEWRQKKGVYKSQNLLRERIDAGWDLAAEQWTGVWRDGALIDVTKNDLATPLTDDHNQLMLELRRLVPKSY